MYQPYDLFGYFVVKCKKENILLQLYFNKLDHSLCACLQITSMPQQDEELVHFSKKQGHHFPTFCTKKKQVGCLGEDCRYKIFYGNEGYEFAINQMF